MSTPTPIQVGDKVTFVIARSKGGSSSLAVRISSRKGKVIKRNGDRLLVRMRNGRDIVVTAAECRREGEMDALTEAWLKAFEQVHGEDRTPKA